MGTVITHSVEIDVAASVEDVFDWLTDTRNHPRWDNSSIEMDALESGPWRQGTEFREVRRMGPRRVEVRSIVEAIDRPHSFDIASVTGPTFRGHWRLSPAGGGDRTTVRWSAEMATTGLARVFEPMIARSFRRVCGASFAQLEGMLEEAPSH